MSADLGLAGPDTSAPTGTPQGAPVIEVTGLVKRYDGRAVVDDVDLRIGRGTIVALLGPNGAGKTTILEVIEGYRRADAGEVRILGQDPWGDRAALRARVGVMLQRTDLYNQVRVLEAVRLFAAFYADPLSPGMLLDQVGLAERADDRYKTLSGGERQRLNLALAIIGRPEVAVLDEPTAAMDVAARRATWGLLRALRGQGTTILMATHLIDEAESLADEVAIIDTGRLVAYGSPADLRASQAVDGSGQAPTEDGPGGRTIRLHLIESLGDADLAALARLPGTRTVRQLGGASYALGVEEPGEALVRLTEWLWAKRIMPLGLDVGGRRLEDVVLRLIEEHRAADGGDEPSAPSPPAPPA